MSGNDFYNCVKVCDCVVKIAFFAVSYATAVMDIDIIWFMFYHFAVVCDCKIAFFVIERAAIFIHTNIIRSQIYRFGEI